MISAIIMASYLLLTIGIGFFLSSSNKKAEDFFVAKKGLGIGLIIPLLFSELIAGAGTIGNAEMAFRTGLSSVWAQWGMVVGCLLYVLLVSRFYWIMGDKLQAMSVPEAFGQYFDEKTRTAAMIMIALAYGIIYATQPISAASILAPMFNISTTVMAWIVGIIIIVITISGGLKGAAYMSIVHSFVMYFGMFITLFFVLKYIGGFQVMQVTLHPGMFNLVEPGIQRIIAWVLGTACSFLTASTVVAVTFGARSLRDAKHGIVIGALLIVPFALAPSFIGLAAKATLPDIIAKSAFFTIAAKAGDGIAGLASMGVVAAILSTAPVVLLITATTLTRDLYKGIIRPTASDSEQMMFSRLAIIIIGLGGTYFGLQSTSILGQLLGALQIRSVAGIVLVIALAWPRVNSRAAFYSIILGGGLAAIWHFSGNPFGLEPLWPSLMLGIPVLITLTLLNKDKVSTEYRKYLELSNAGVKIEATKPYHATPEEC